MFNKYWWEENEFKQEFQYFHAGAAGWQLLSERLGIVSRNDISEKEEQIFHSKERFGFFLPLWWEKKNHFLIPTCISSNTGIYWDNAVVQKLC